MVFDLPRFSDIVFHVFTISVFVSFFLLFKVYDGDVKLHRKQLILIRLFCWISAIYLCLA